MPIDHPHTCLTFILHTFYKTPPTRQTCLFVAAAAAGARIFFDARVRFVKVTKKRLPWSGQTATSFVTYKIKFRGYFFREAAVLDQGIQEQCFVLST